MYNPESGETGWKPGKPESLTTMIRTQPCQDTGCVVCAGIGSPYVSLSPYAFEEGMDAIELANLLSSYGSLYQSTKIHEKETATSKSLHREALLKSQRHHDENVRIAKQSYLMESATALEQHFQQLNADLLHSSRESERDMFDQRNQQFQTIILASSVMLSALSTVIIQGYLPLTSSDFIIISYGLTGSLSFAFLFLCIVMCIEVVTRASSFMYRRAKKHTESLGDAINQTKRMMQAMRNMTTGIDDNISNNDNIANTSSSSEKNRGTRSPTTPHRCKILKPEHAADVEHEWQHHEEKVHTYLNQREKINRQTAIIDISNHVDTDKQSFEQFWKLNCSFFGDLAVIMFYCGATNLLFAIMLFMWAQFYTNYSSVVGAIIAVVLIGVALITGLMLPLIIKNQQMPNGVKRALDSRRTDTSDSRGSWSSAFVDSGKKLSKRFGGRQYETAT